MQIKNLNNRAVTLLEVLLAAVIFMLSVAGIFVTLSAVRAPVANKENALSATVFGKQVLESLYSQVSDSTYYATSCVVTNDGLCGDFSLVVGQHEIANASPPLPSGLSWPATLAAVNTCASVATGCLRYNVTCADGSAGASCGGNPSIAKRVDLNINWPTTP